jgi:hypothetical protein
VLGSVRCLERSVHMILDAFEIFEAIGGDLPLLLAGLGLMLRREAGVACSVTPLYCSRKV